MNNQNYPKTVCVNSANRIAIEWITKAYSEKRDRIFQVAELGIYEGHTSEEIANIIQKNGVLHLFDFQDRVDRVAHRIEKMNITNIKKYGCSYRFLDSYNWSLIKLLEKNKQPIFDYVFIDGAHTVAIDALAFYLSDRLLKIGGYIQFDDYSWTIVGSPTLNPNDYPEVNLMYTDEQMQSKQVALIVETLVRSSGKYDEVARNKVFRKTK